MQLAYTDPLICQEKNARAKIMPELSTGCGVNLALSERESKRDLGACGYVDNCE
jgi:hypothetical protein